jgi:hypothetical protein
LLAQESILYNQIGTAVNQIGKQSRDPRWRSRLGPVFDAILKPEKEFANQAAPRFCNE